VTEPTELSAQLQALGGDIHGPLEEVSVPMYVLDREGTIVWLNDAAKKLMPEAQGRNFTEILTPDLVSPSRRHFTLRMLGYEPFVDHRVVVKGRGGEHEEVEISSAPLRKDHRIVGVFGVLRAHRPAPTAETGAGPATSLTPRQHQVLRLLGAGLTTRQMADHMGLSVETVRNHVRMLLAQLGARSRLEAVLVAHHRGLLERPGRPLD
jgi:PAS domain S-box-containing protein